MIANIYKSCLIGIIMKKSQEEIKNAILSALEFKPLSVQQISEKINSNWATVNEFLEELKKDGKVKELISTEKIKLYQRITEDTYYSIPITEEKRKEFRYIFSLVIDKYKQIKKRMPNKTELAKVVVDTIKIAKLDLPTAWYIYGQIPLMIVDPARDYNTDFIRSNNEEISKIVINIIQEQKHSSTKELRQEHYTKYNNLLYETKEKLFSKDLNWNKDTQKVLELYNCFLVNCPNNPPELFFLTEKLTGLVYKLFSLGRLTDYKIDILVSTDCLWKFISLNLFLSSLIEIKEYSNKKEIYGFYLAPAFEVKRQAVEESLSNLESIYLSNLSDKEIELSDKATKVREIMSDWTGE